MLELLCDFSYEDCFHFVLLPVIFLHLSEMHRSAISLYFGWMLFRYWVENTYCLENV
nr:hypothetical protein [Sicyoidochytrium minutum DNA virus]